MSRGYVPYPARLAPHQARTNLWRAWDGTHESLTAAPSTNACSLGAGTTVDLVTGDAAVGTKFLKFTQNVTEFELLYMEMPLSGNGGEYVEQYAVEVDGDTSYDISFYAKRLDGSDGNFVLSGWSDDANHDTVWWTQFSELSFAPPSTTWQRVTHRLTTPLSAQWMTLNFYAVDTTDPTQLGIDQIYVSRA